jgi:hypothetical protein
MICIGYHGIGNKKQNPEKLHPGFHWIGLRENLQETMVFTSFYHQIDRVFL